MGAVSLTGVLEVAGPRDPSLPTNPRATLRYTRGSTLTVSLTVLQSTGVPVDLSAAGTSLSLVVKRSSLEEEQLLSLTGTIVSAVWGTATFAIPSTALKYNDPGRFVYDIWLLTTTTKDPVIPTSPFIYEPSMRTP